MRTSGNLLLFLGIVLLLEGALALYGHYSPKVLATCLMRPGLIIGCGLWLRGLPSSGLHQASSQPRKAGP